MPQTTQRVKTFHEEAIGEELTDWTYPGLVDTFPSCSDHFSRSSLLELSGA